MDSCTMDCSYFTSALLGHYIFARITPRDAFMCKNLRARSLEHHRSRKNHRYTACFWSIITLAIEEVNK
ncbi:unnamed protein product [Cylicocyclus nassatus]|uniref:Uncharacterized protein n=1 Tax=Cylicocyclus nassatus TaxID=53992 RepID=A0AA36HB36_CYLNA|nr:unnamed protein product [Cylicocyclus nassatus]